MRSFLLILFLLLLVLPASGQTCCAGWKYQTEIHLDTDGGITFSYLKRNVEMSLIDHTSPTGVQTILNDDSRIFVSSSLISVENANQKNQLTPDYYLRLNKHMNPVISTPDYQFRNRFPQSSQNQFFPLPEGN